MQQLLSAFGIDWQLLGAQAVNFGLVMIALWYFLYKPVMRILAERQELVEKSIEDAKKTSAIFEGADEEAKRRVKDADDEAEKIVAAARDAASSERGRMLRDAENRAAVIAKDAEARATDTVERAERESEQAVARLAVLAAEKILREKA